MVYKDCQHQFILTEKVGTLYKKLNVFNVLMRLLLTQSWERSWLADCKIFHVNILISLVTTTDGVIVILSNSDWELR